MTVEQMIQKKKELGCSNQLIADLSGVPLGTVQKIFSGSTKAPRYHTLQALDKVFSEMGSESDKLEVPGDLISQSGVSILKEPQPAYQPGYYRAASVRRIGDKTIEDYLALPEGTRVELIDGVFYDMAAPGTIHQRIAGQIFYTFEKHIIENGGSCVPFIAPTDVQLDCDDKTMVQPDVMIVCDRDKLTRPRLVGAPDLIVEVVSPSNWKMDVYLKLKKYKNAGVREYWVVLPEEKSVMVYRFETSREPIEYTFDDKVPVGIWENQCEVDFSVIYDRIRFLYEK